MIGQVEREDGKNADVRPLVRYWIASRTMSNSKQTKAMVDFANTLDE